MVANSDSTFALSRAAIFISEKKIETEMIWKEMGGKG